VKPRLRERDCKEFLIQGTRRKPGVLHLVFSTPRFLSRVLAAGEPALRPAAAGSGPSAHWIGAKRRSFLSGLKARPPKQHDARDLGFGIRTVPSADRHAALPSFLRAGKAALRLGSGPSAALHLDLFRTGEQVAGREPAGRRRYLNGPAREDINRAKLSHECLGSEEKLSSGAKAQRLLQLRCRSCPSTGGGGLRARSTDPLN